MDHDHETMVTMGLVCTRCNIGLLAFSNHDADTVKRLWEFLVNPPTQRVLGRVVLANPAKMEHSKPYLKALHDTIREPRQVSGGDATMRGTMEVNGASTLEAVPGGGPRVLRSGYKQVVGDGLVEA